jgi:hypothetical protein
VLHAAGGGQRQSTPPGGSRNASPRAPELGSARARCVRARALSPQLILTAVLVSETRAHPHSCAYSSEAGSSRTTTPARDAARLAPGASAKARLAARGAPSLGAPAKRRFTLLRLPTVPTRAQFRSINPSIDEIIDAATQSSQSQTAASPHARPAYCQDPSHRICLLHRSATVASELVVKWTRINDYAKPRPTCRLVRNGLSARRNRQDFILKQSRNRPWGGERGLRRKRRTRPWTRRGYG